MNKKQKFFAGLVLVFIVGSIFVYRYLYKDHRNIANESTAFQLQAKELIQNFEKDTETATSTYLDKTIEISGVITDIEDKNFTLNHAILCYTDSISMKKLTKQNSTTIKGRFIGYDELLENIKLDQVIVIK